MELIPNSELNPSADEVEMIAAAQKEFKQVCFNFFGKEIDRIEAIHLDYAYTYFKKKTFWSKKKRNYSVLVLGSVIGELLCRDFGYEWKNWVYDDVDGTELGVKHKESYSIGHPFSIVRKRIRTQEYGYFTAVYEMFGDLKKENP